MPPRSWFSRSRRRPWSPTRWLSVSRWAVLLVGVGVLDRPVRAHLAGGQAGRRTGQAAGRCVTIRLRHDPGGDTTMRQPMRPAAYIRVRPGHGSLSPAQRAAILEVASQRGWPEPTIYADDGQVQADGYGQALARLSAAISAGRHDAVIMASTAAMSRSPARLMAFLVRCTHHGVAVEFTSPRAAPPS